MSQSRMQTVLSLEDKEFKQKLAEVERLFSDKMGNMAEANSELSLSTKELNKNTTELKAKQVELSRSNQELAESKRKLKEITKAEKEAINDIANAQKELVALGSELAKANKTEKASLQDKINTIKNLIAVKEKEKADLIEQRTNTRQMVSNTQQTIAETKKYIASLREKNVVLGQSKRLIQEQIKILREEAKARDQARKVVEAQAKAEDNGVAIRNQAITSLVRYIRQINTLVIATYSLNKAYDLTIGKGITLNKELQTSELGIATLIASKMADVDASGKQVTAADKLRQSMVMSKGVVEDLRAASLETTAGINVMMEAYRNVIGHALQAGYAMGGSFEEINKNTISFVKNMSILGQSMGMEDVRLYEEVRSLMAGTASQDSMLAIMLFGGAAAANQKIRDSKKTLNGLSKLFGETFDEINESAKINTLDKEINRIKKSYEDMVKSATINIMPELEKTAGDLAKWLRENQGEISQVIKDFIDQAKKLFAFLKDFYEMVKPGITLVFQLARVFGELGIEVIKLADTLMILKPLIAGFAIYKAGALAVGAFTFAKKVANKVELEFIATQTAMQASMVATQATMVGAQVKTNSLTASMMALNAVMKANPILLVAGVASTAFALYDMGKWMTTVSDSTEKMVKQNDKLKYSISGVSSDKYKDLARNIKATEEKIKLLNDRFHGKEMPKQYKDEIAKLGEELKSLKLVAQQTKETLTENLITSNLNAQKTMLSEIEQQLQFFKKTLDDPRYKGKTAKDLHWNFEGEYATFEKIIQKLEQRASGLREAIRLSDAHLNKQIGFKTGDVPKDKDADRLQSLKNEIEKKKELLDLDAKENESFENRKNKIDKEIEVLKKQHSVLKDINELTPKSELLNLAGKDVAKAKAIESLLDLYIKQKELTEKNTEAQKKLTDEIEKQHQILKNIRENDSTSYETKRENAKIALMELKNQHDFLRKINREDIESLKGRQDLTTEQKKALIEFIGLYTKIEELDDQKQKKIAQINTSAGNFGNTLFEDLKNQIANVGKQEDEIRKNRIEFLEKQVKDIQEDIEKAVNDSVKRTRLEKIELETTLELTQLKMQLSQLQSTFSDTFRGAIQSALNGSFDFNNIARSFGSSLAEPLIKALSDGFAREAVTMLASLKAEFAKMFVGTQFKGSFAGLNSDAILTGGIGLAIVGLTALFSHLDSEAKKAEEATNKLREALKNYHQNVMDMRIKTERLRGNEIRAKELEIEKARNQVGNSSIRTVDQWIARSKTMQFQTAEQVKAFEDLGNALYDLERSTREYHEAIIRQYQDEIKAKEELARAIQDLSESNTRAFIDALKAEEDRAQAIEDQSQRAIKVTLDAIKAEKDRLKAIEDLSNSAISLISIYESQESHMDAVTKRTRDALRAFRDLANSLRSLATTGQETINNINKMGMKPDELKGFNVAQYQQAKDEFYSLFQDGKLKDGKDAELKIAYDRINSIATALGDSFVALGETNQVRGLSTELIEMQRLVDENATDMVRQLRELILLTVGTNEKLDAIFGAGFTDKQKEALLNLEGLSADQKAELKTIVGGTFTPDQLTKFLNDIGMSEEALKEVSKSDGLLASQKQALQDLADRTGGSPTDNVVANLESIRNAILGELDFQAVKTSPYDALGYNQIRQLFAGAKEAGIEGTENVKAEYSKLSAFLTDKEAFTAGASQAQMDRTTALASALGFRNEAETGMAMFNEGRQITAKEARTKGFADLSASEQEFLASKATEDQYNALFSALQNPTQDISSKTIAQIKETARALGLEGGLKTDLDELDTNLALNRQFTADFIKSKEFGNELGAAKLEALRDKGIDETAYNNLRASLKNSSLDLSIQDIDARATTANRLGLDENALRASLQAHYDATAPITDRDIRDKEWSRLSPSEKATLDNLGINEDRYKYLRNLYTSPEFISSVPSINDLALARDQFQALGLYSAVQTRFQERAVNLRSTPEEVTSLGAIGNHGNRHIKNSIKYENKGDNELYTLPDGNLYFKTIHAGGEIWGKMLVDPWGWGNKIHVNSGGVNYPTNHEFWDGVNVYRKRYATIGSHEGFFTGGYTGNGNIYDPAGIVHGREYVLNAKTTKKLGLDSDTIGNTFDMMNKELRSIKTLMIKLVSDNDKILKTDRALLDVALSA